MNLPNGWLSSRKGHNHARPPRPTIDATTISDPDSAKAIRAGLHNGPHAGAITHAAFAEFLGDAVV